MRNKDISRSGIQFLSITAALFLLAAGVIAFRAFDALSSAPAAVRDTEPQVTSIPSPVPTAAPTPTPLPVDIRLEGIPVSDTLQPGTDAVPDGTIKSSYPILSVCVTDDCAYNFSEIYPMTAAVSFQKEDSITELALSSVIRTINEDKEEDPAVRTRFCLGDLTPGLHTMRVYAVCAGCLKEHLLYEGNFYVLSDEWNRIVKKNFGSGNGYDSALAFFKDTDAFLYRYQWVNGRYTVADPEWEETYITSIDGYGGRPWLIHKDAIPYYEKAFSLLAKVHLRVRGSNGDTGIIPLSDCIITYNGSYVSRFTSSLKTISHHAFGTASDINAAMEPNLNKKENRALIDNAVKKKLVYNGILEENGVLYYDFSYFGEGPCTENGLPEIVINYLLYELAFYRAGFQWGHYYVSTSDAMHFSLSETTGRTHDDRNGLRKVFTYIPGE